MNQMIENLIGLQALEVSDEKGPSGLARIKEMRQRIPGPVLLHYDRLRGRGKKGVVLVQNGVCRQCHMQVATGLLASLQRQDGIHCCQTCGAYVYVEETAIETQPGSVKSRSAKAERQFEEADPDEAAE